MTRGELRQIIGVELFAALNNEQIELIQHTLGSIKIPRFDVDEFVEYIDNWRAPGSDKIPMVKGSVSDFVMAVRLDEREKIIRRLESVYPENISGLPDRAGAFTQVKREIEKLKTEFDVV
jgi:hypothetical protein